MIIVNKCGGAIPKAPGRGSGCGDTQRESEKVVSGTQRRWPFGPFAHECSSIALKITRSSSYAKALPFTGMISHSYSGPSNNSCLWSLIAVSLRASTLYLALHREGGERGTERERRERERERGRERERERERPGLSVDRCNVCSLGAVVTCVRKREGGRLITGHPKALRSDGVDGDGMMMMMMSSVYSRRWQRWAVHISASHAFSSICMFVCVISPSCGDEEGGGWWWRTWEEGARRKDGRKSIK